MIKGVKIFCLCGSTRFTRDMLILQWNLTKLGYVVLSWCALPDDYYKGEDRAHIGDQEGVKAIVDEVHFRKIDLADEVLVLNIGGYIGESTRNEINYAKLKGKIISYVTALAEGERVYICPEDCHHFRGEDGCNSPHIDMSAVYEIEGDFPTCPFYFKAIMRYN